MSDDLKSKFIEAVKPLMKFLCENCNPHSSVIVTGTNAELLHGAIVFKTEEYLVD